MPGAGRTWNQVPLEHEEAGHLAHAGAWETVLKVGWAVGGRQAAEHVSPITFPPQPAH